MSGLQGMKDICNYVRRSEPTVLNWIYSEGFPATKLSGVWMSDSELIDTWRKDKIVNGQDLPERIVKQKNKK